MSMFTGPEHRCIKLAKIIVNSGQARKSFPREEIETLAQSLKVRGQLNALIVRYDAGRDLYILSSGERRFRAMQLLGWEEAECKVLDREPDEADMLEESIVENELRASLKPLELGRALERLQTLKGGTLASIAESLHLSPATVTRAMSLLLLPPDVQGLVDDGRLNGRAAYAISRMSDTAAQREVAELAASGKLTCTQTEELVQSKIGKRASKPKVAKVTCKEGDYSLTLLGPVKERMEEMLVVLLRQLRGELRNGG